MNEEVTGHHMDQAFEAEAEQWAEKQWAQAGLGDARLRRRAVAVGGKMARLAGASLPRQMADWAELKATYRLLDNDKVTYEALSKPHWEATRQRAAEERVVLLVQDTSELDFTRYAETMAGLGPIGDGRGRGLLLHTTLAVVPQPRQILGIAHQEVFLRKPVARKDRRRRPKEERESRVWGESVRTIGAPPPESRWVVVADRAGDNTDFLLTCRETGMDFNVRMAHEHRLISDEGPPRYLMATARTWQPVVGKIVSLRSRAGRPAREARVLVSYGRVQLRVPRGQVPLTVWVIRAWEVDAPEGAEPMEWVLATSVPVERAEDALERLTWYGARWLVEDYHQCLKTGCAIEHRDLEHADRVKRLLGFQAPIAVRLLQLRETTRYNPAEPAAAVADPLAVAILAAHLGLPASGMTVHTFAWGVARLGGFIGRRHDGEPGWKTLWKGWLHLEAMLQGARLAASLNDP